MANTLTSLIPDLYEALDQVSRELTGFIPAVNRDNSVDRAELNENVIVPVTGAEASADNTAAVAAPDTGDTTVNNVAITISKSKHVPVRFNGEETKGLNNAGSFGGIMQDRFRQGMRTLVNEIETDLWTEAYQSASRGYGTAATAPFGTINDMTDFAGVLGILEANGAPMNDVQLVLGHAAMAELRGVQAGLFRVNEAGSSDMLRNGMTDRIMGMAIRHSDAVGIHTKGTGTGYLIDDAASAAGDTAIVLDTGTGTVVAGDIVTFAGTADKYVVGAGIAAPGTISIGGPGLLVGETDSDAMTIGGDYTANVAFSRNAMVLATRMPAAPEGGDSADDVQTIVDDRTGLAFEVAHYRQFLQNTIHIRAAWGVGAVADRHIATLLG